MWFSICSESLSLKVRRGFYRNTFNRLDPDFLKQASDFTAEARAHIFNLRVIMKEVPKIWKSAFVLPLLEGSTQLYTNIEYVSTPWISHKWWGRGIFTHRRDFIILSIRFQKRAWRCHSCAKVVNWLFVALDLCCTFYWFVQSFWCSRPCCFYT